MTIEPKVVDFTENIKSSELHLHVISECVLALRTRKIIVESPSVNLFNVKILLL